MRIPDITPVDMPPWFCCFSVEGAGNVTDGSAGGRLMMTSHSLPVYPTSQEHCMLVVHLYNNYHKIHALQKNKFDQ